MSLTRTPPPSDETEAEARRAWARHSNFIVALENERAALENALLGVRARTRPALPNEADRRTRRRPPDQASGGK